MKKFVKIEEGSYRSNDMSGRIFLLLKDYQKFDGGKPGGFVTVDVKDLGGFTGKDKARINVPDISKITITTEGEYIKHIDELKSTTTVENPKENNETDEQAIERIAARFSILDEMAEAVNEGKVRAMIVSGPPGIGRSYGVERALAKRSMFDDIA